MTVTLDELKAAILADEKVESPFFDGAQLDVFLDRDQGDLIETSEIAARAIHHFLQLGTADRLDASRHVHAYYEDFRDAVGGEDWMDDEFGRIVSAEDVWAHVDPKVLQVMTETDGTGRVVPYVVLEANCDWESEHGLLMSWENGSRLVKVGGYDGHPLNGYPGAEDGNWYVYWGTPRFRTTAE